MSYRIIQNNSTYVKSVLLNNTKTQSRVYIGTLMICDGIIFIQRVVCFLSPNLGEGIENTQLVG